MTRSATPGDRTADPDAALRAELVNAMEAHEEGRRGGAYPHLGQMNDIVRFVDWLVDWLEKFAPSALYATASPGQHCPNCDHEHPLESPGLDVERLGEALRRTGALWSSNDYYEVTTDSHEFAEAIAREYAALAADREGAG